MVRRKVETDSGRNAEAPDHKKTGSAATPVAAVMRIEEVSRRTGLSKRTLRYYEELGLLEPAQRSEGNYRMYRLEDVTTLERIKEMRDLLGLELSEIRDMVEYELGRERARSQWRHDEAPGSRLEAIAEAERMTRKQLHLIETRVEALNNMGQSLRERLANYERLRAEIESLGARTEPDTGDEGER